MTSDVDVLGDESYRSQLDQTLSVPGIRVFPPKFVGKYLQRLKGLCYCHRGIKHVVDEDATSSPNGADQSSSAGKQSLAKVILVDPSKVEEARKNAESVTSELNKAANVVNASEVMHQVSLTYRSYTMPEILAKVLPENVVALSGFEQVGHIAHVNLSPGHLPYKYIIGQVIVDCNPTVRTVVNKVDTISTVFREFPMEVIAGKENDLVAEVKQYGCVFRFPYDKVYWNSRLGHEHERLVQLTAPSDELYDVMGGVGPFAIPAGLKGVVVHANDLNPASYVAMMENVELNGCPKNNVKCYNMDGRDFINKVIRVEALESSVLSPASRKRHMTMNLPALAVEFLDCFREECWRSGKVVDKKIVIHVYTFSAALDPSEDAVHQVETVLGHKIDRKEDLIASHLVRDVAPTKMMVCVSFTLPAAVFTQPPENEDTYKRSTSQTSELQIARRKRIREDEGQVKEESTKKKPSRKSVNIMGPPSPVIRGKEGPDLSGSPPQGRPRRGSGGESMVNAGLSGYVLRSRVIGGSDNVEGGDGYHKHSYNLRSSTKNAPTEGEEKKERR